MAEQNRLTYADHGFVGVRWQPSGRYGAVICGVWLGTFETAAEAARAYDAASRYLNGLGVNFPLENTPIAERVLARLIAAGRIAAPAPAAAIDAAPAAQLPEP